MQLRGDPAGGRRLGGDVQDVRGDEGGHDRAPARVVRARALRRERRRAHAAAARGQRERGQADRREDERVVVGPRRDHQQRPDHRADAVAGVGHAEPVRAPDLGRAHEQRVEREVQPAEPQADDDDRGEELGEAARQGHAGRADGHRRERPRQHRAAGEAAQGDPAQRHAEQRAQEVRRSPPWPAAGSETWNLCENVTSSGPYREAVAPKTMKVAVAPAKAGAREGDVARRRRRRGVGVHSTGAPPGVRPSRAARAGRDEEGALARAVGLVALARRARRRARRDLGDGDVPPRRRVRRGHRRVGLHDDDRGLGGGARVGQRGGELVAGRRADRPGAQARARWPRGRPAGSSPSSPVAVR